MSDLKEDYDVEIHRGLGGGPMYGTVFYIGDGSRTEIGKTPHYTGAEYVKTAAREIAQRHSEGPEIVRFSL